MSSEETGSGGGLRDMPRDSASVSRYYDDWADEYDQTLAEWGYEAHQRAAERLRGCLEPPAAILDAGCGTGLSGEALHGVGFRTVDGMDVSATSLAIARRRGVYRSLAEVDMTRLPLPYDNDVYGGLVCVGVLTYVPDSDAIVREFARILAPGAPMVLTQRSDLHAERDFPGTMRALEREGIVDEVDISGPMPYLPGNEEFGDELRVHYITCRAR